MSAGSFDNAIEFRPPAPKPRPTHRFVASPVGELLLVSDGAALCGLYLVGARYAAGVPEGSHTDEDLLDDAARQLEGYFSGSRRSFELAVAPAGTEFQLSVWHHLASIPYGETRTYGEIATALGRPRAPRAVGAANGQNPISVIVPCHRVIGSTGSLTGYAGGLDRKAALLGLEVRGRAG